MKKSLTTCLLGALVLSLAACPFVFGQSEIEYSANKSLMRLPSPYAPLGTYLAQNPLPPPNPNSPPEEIPSGQRKPIGGQQPIGEAPPDDINELFLRQSTLLLEPGTYQLEAGFNYTWQETNAVLVLPTGQPVLERIRNRRFQVPFSIRYGYHKYLEVFATMPFGVGLFERDSVAGEITDSTGALGDMSAGFVYQLLESRDGSPDVTTTFSFTAPTGNNPFRSPNGNVASLGNGFWIVGGSMNFIKSYDPVVCFAGAGYQYTFGREISGTFIQPGHTATYNFGMAMAVNDDVSLSAQVQGAYQTTAEFAGTTIPNSNNEPVLMQFALIRRISPITRVQPIVSFGLNSDAPDFFIGVNFIRDIKPGCMWFR